MARRGIVASKLIKQGCKFRKRCITQHVVGQTALGRCLEEYLFNPDATVTGVQRNLTELAGPVHCMRGQRRMGFAGSSDIDPQSQQPVITGG